MKKFISGFLCCAVLCSICIFASNSLANQPIYLVIDHNTIQCDVPPQIINGRVMVPARYVAEALGAEVEWSDKYNTVFIHSKNTTHGQTTQPIQSVQQQQVILINSYYNKLKSTSKSLVVVLENPNREDLNAQIKYLTSLENELTTWGTLDEYKEIKRLYLQCVNQMGKALIYTRGAISSNSSPMDYKMATDYMYRYHDTVLQINAELDSLKLKGLL